MGMIGTEGCFADRERALAQRFGIGITTLPVVQQTAGCSAMSQHRDDRDRALSLVLPTRVCIAARLRHSDPACVENSKIVQRLRDIRMIGTEGLFAYRQRALVQRLSIGITTLDSI